MLKRLITASLLILLMPAAALADTSLSPDPASAPADQLQTGTGGAASLGPAATTQSAGGSNADGGTLQPAGTTPIQSDSSTSSWLTAPASALQAPASTSDALTVLSNEADGGPHSTLAEQSPDLTWLWLVLLLGIVVGGLYYVLRRHEKLAEY